MGGAPLFNIRISSTLTSNRAEILFMPEISIKYIISKYSRRERERDAHLTCPANGVQERDESESIETLSLSYIGRNFYLCAIAAGRRSILSDNERRRAVLVAVFLGNIFSTSYRSAGRVLSDTPRVNYWHRSLRGDGN